ncbi:Alpha/Beta hydrolase protein [Hyaloraphidium curvatum]|nr:Alpha/Beta hydrolase protein [Hyaloraphidium curvatum]
MRANAALATCLTRPRPRLRRIPTAQSVCCAGLLPPAPSERPPVLAQRRTYAKHSFTAAPVDLAFDEYGPELTADRTAPIVILHGLFGSKRNWRGPAKALASKAKTHVFALDLRNHGNSPHTADMDYESMASDVAHFIESKGLPPPTLLGHSMGGKVAMTLGLRNSKLTHSLIVADMAPVATKPTSLFQNYARALRKLAAAKPDDLKHADQLLAADVPEKGIRAFLLTNFQPDATLGHLVPLPNLDAIAQHLDNIFDFPEGKSPTSHYNKPCLFIAGANSNYVNPSHKDIYAKLFPTVEIVQIAGAGHWIHADKPHEFIDTVVRFIGHGHRPDRVVVTDKERFSSHSHAPHDRRK